MITVSILINGQPIFTRSAINTGKKEGGRTIYSVDDGRILYHAREDEAIPLAISMLQTIKEPK